MTITKSHEMVRFFDMLIIVTLAWNIGEVHSMNGWPMWHSAAYEYIDWGFDVPAYDRPIYGDDRHDRCHDDEPEIKVQYCHDFSLKYSQLIYKKSLTLGKILL